MNYTENLQLKKPEQEEFYDVDDFNYNADIIDAETKDIRDNYLSLNGGTMRGDIHLDGHAVFGNSPYIQAGTSWDNGARLQLFSKNENGNFSLLAKKDDDLCFLNGTPNGSLTWCDEELATEKHVSDNYLSLNGGIMKGDIGLDGNNIYGNWYRLRNNDDSSFIGLSGGGSYTWETSSTLVLFGNNAGDNAGKAVLNSHGHNLAVCQNGQLLFNNKNLVRSVNGVNADTSGNVTIQDRMPDYSAGVSVSLVNSQLNFTASTDGYFVLSGLLGKLYINGLQVGYMVAYTGWDGCISTIILNKGDVLTTSGVIGNYRGTFFPCKGAN